MFHFRGRAQREGNVVGHCSLKDAAEMLCWLSTLAWVKNYDNVPEITSYHLKADDSIVLEELPGLCLYKPRWRLPFGPLSSLCDSISAHRVHYDGQT